MVTVFTDTDELQDDIFDHFVIHPNVKIEWVRADQINTWFQNTVHAGNISCSSTNSTVTVDNNQRTVTVTHGEVPQEEKVVEAHRSVEEGASEEELRLIRVGPVRNSKGQPVAHIAAGQSYRVMLAAVRHGARVGKPHAARFRVRCRITSSRGCLR